MPLTCDRSLANRTHPEYKIVHKEKFFPSRQVRMCGCRIRPCNTSRLTTHARGIDRLSELFKSKPPLNIQPESKQKIFPQSKFKCLVSASRLEINYIEHCMHVALTGCRVSSNRTHLWIQNCSAGKFFCIRTRSNVWVSYQASRYTRHGMACMWH